MNRQGVDIRSRSRVELMHKTQAKQQVQMCIRTGGRSAGLPHHTTCDAHQGTCCACARTSRADGRPSTTAGCLPRPRVRHRCCSPPKSCDMRRHCQQTPATRGRPASRTVASYQLVSIGLGKAIKRAIAIPCLSQTTILAGAASSRHSGRSRGVSRVGVHVLRASPLWRVTRSRLQRRLLQPHELC